jgi:hypothetical protein
MGLIDQKGYVNFLTRQALQDNSLSAEILVSLLFTPRQTRTFSEDICIALLHAVSNFDLDQDKLVSFIVLSNILFS